MAIAIEYHMTREDGVILYRTYSDIGLMIERDGVRYNEAIDPEGSDRVYIETTEPIIEEEIFNELKALLANYPEQRVDLEEVHRYTILAGEYQVYNEGIEGKL